MFQNTWYQIGRTIVNVYVHHILRADIHRPGCLPAGAKIIVANHPSTSDPAYVTILFKEQSTILIKETLFKVPLFGRSLRMAGHIPVVAGNGRAALEEGMRLLRAGRTLVVFPEGDISPDGGFHKAHTGAARLALATGAPVIPVGISLNQRKLRLINTRVEGKLETGAWYLHGPYAMTVGEPVTFQGSAEDHEQVKAVTGQIMQNVALLSYRGHTRLANRGKRLAPAAQPHSTMHSSASRLSTASPSTTLHVAWQGTWLSIQQSARVVARSPLFRTIESALVILLMIGRHP